MYVMRGYFCQYWHQVNKIVVDTLGVDKTRVDQMGVHCTYILTIISICVVVHMLIWGMLAGMSSHVRKDLYTVQECGYTDGVT